jgi:hypothetical protein
MNIIRIKAEDVHMFRVPTSRPNIAYSVVEYEEDKLGRGGNLEQVNILHQYLPPEASELFVQYLWLMLPFWQRGCR